MSKTLSNTFYNYYSLHYFICYNYYSYRFTYSSGVQLGEYVRQNFTIVMKINYYDVSMDPFSFVRASWCQTKLIHYLIDTIELE